MKPHVTGNNGDFIGCVEGSKETYRLEKQRPYKILDLIQSNKNFYKEMAPNFLPDIQKN